LKTMNATELLHTKQTCTSTDTGITRNLCPISIQNGLSAS
jgi:hypothetical protein